MEKRPRKRRPRKRDHEEETTKKGPGHQKPKEQLVEGEI
jgi:hypothetical protein